MPRSREQEAGVLYEEGAKAVRAGGHELSMLASHLIFMVKGTAVYQGSLWPLRILHDGREIRLDRFMDYLTKPARVGLGLPSMHFLRQVLKATPDRGEEALGLVQEELRRELIDFDSVADHDRDAELARRTRRAGAREGGRPTNAAGEGSAALPLPKGSKSAARIVARLKRDAPAIAERFAAGGFRSARAAGIAAGIIVPPTKLAIALKAFRALSPEDQQRFRDEIG